MRLTTVLLIATLMQVSAAGLAQRITLKERNASLENVLKEIRRQSGYDIFFNGQLLDKAKDITVQVTNVNLEEALKASLNGLPLAYKLEGKTVTIIAKEEPSFLDKASLVILNAVKNLYQDPVRGKVVDEQGNPMPNATIVVKGKSQVYRSNNKGEFNIPNVADDAVLVISYVGYQRLEINVKDAVMPLEIKLNMATGELEEVNIQYSTGYQDIPKERATGSFEQIDNKLINRSVSTNILDRLNRVVGGLNFQSTPGGRNSGIMIRGNSTINANQNPLLVVDGFPYDESANNANIINNVNPNDIESITVLRDAAAASIWGARSGNGVIVITTKKGRYNQKTNIQFNGNMTVGDKPDLGYFRTISSADFIKLERKIFADSVYNEYDDSYPASNYYPILPTATEILLAKRKGSITSEQAEKMLSTLERYDVKDDIRKYLLQRSLNQQYALSFSGGSNNYNYYGSVGYDKNRLNNVRDENDRLTIRYENTYKPIPKLELNSYLVYVQSNNKRNGLNYNSFLPVGGGTSPYTMLADANGNPLSIPYKLGGIRTAYTDTVNTKGLVDWRYRPLEELRMNDNSDVSIDNRIGFGAKYELIHGLNAEIRYQYQKSTTTERRLYSMQSIIVRDLVNKYRQVEANGSFTYPVPNNMIVDDGSMQLVGHNIRGQLIYSNKWNNHELALIGGAEAREAKSVFNSGRNYGYDVNTSLVATNINYNTQYPLGPDGFNYATVPNGNNYDGTTNRYISYFANAAYTFKSKYTVSASGRIDGSNFLGIQANQKMTPLWSIGGTWNISKETLYGLTWLPVLKLRATYGYNGNLYNSVTAYPTIQHRSEGAVNLTRYAEITSPGNPNLRWEKIKIANLALDFETGNSRITGSVEYYRKKGVELIGNIIADPTTGFKNFIGNHASIKGAGVDLTINSINTKGRIKWSTNFLLSYNTDKVTNYESTSKNTSAYVSGLPFVGNPLFSVISYHYAGLNPANGDPLFYVSREAASFSDASTKAGPEDLIFHGSAIPKYFGSFRNTLSYRQLSASFNLAFKLDYFFRKTSVNYSSLINGWGGHADYALRWQNPGDEAITSVPSFPSIQNTNRDNLYKFSDILVRKGDHIRLQDIRLNYDFSSSSIKNLPVQNMQLYLYANNLGILWRANDDGIDPDRGDQSIPLPRSVAIGLSVKF